MARLPVPNGDAQKWGGILNDFLLQQHAADGTHDVAAILQIPASNGSVFVSSTAQAAGAQWRTLTAGDVGLGNVTNDAQVKASDIDTDIGLAADSNTKVPSQKAVKTYVDGITQQKANSADVVALAVAL